MTLMHKSPTVPQVLCPSLEQETQNACCPKRRASCRRVKERSIPFPAWRVVEKAGRPSYQTQYLHFPSLSFGIEQVNPAEQEAWPLLLIQISGKRITQAACTKLGPGHINVATQQGGNRRALRCHYSKSPSLQLCQGPVSNDHSHWGSEVSQGQAPDQAQVTPATAEAEAQCQKQAGTGTKRQ